ncbi:MAG: hypothetical protein H0U74_17370 [Bradymonadaceae bacterium]|nr:hypothetical protein [Lujinxingiaceae bacterium]
MQRLWSASLVAFVVAAAGGVLFRGGMIDGFSLGFVPNHIRHAHSHLMLMGWATPALMTLIVTSWARRGARAPRGTAATIWIAWGLAMASFAPFLLHGYKSFDVGFARMPVAAIVSGLCILSWYAFAAIYVRATRGVVRDAALRCFDVAVFFLCISSLGAWAEGMLMALKVTDTFWLALMIHFFVDLFGEGWLMIGLLGLMYAWLPGEEPRFVGRYLALMVAGLGTLFFLGMPSAMVEAGLRAAGHVGALLVGLGMLGHLKALWPRMRAQRSLLWTVVAAMLVLKTAAFFAAAMPPVLAWASSAGLRLIYLHLGFLGFGSIALVALARHVWGKRAFGGAEFFAGACLFLLATLVPLSGLWPVALGGRWTLWLAAIGAALPGLVVLGQMVAWRKVCAPGVGAQNLRTPGPKMALTGAKKE